MNEKKLIIWFWNLFNSCYPVKHNDYPKSIFMYYDEKFIRKIKLCKLSNTEIKYPEKVNGECLFELDLENNYFFYNYKTIYLFLKYNYSDDYKKIQKFIQDRLDETGSKLTSRTETLPSLNNTTNKLSILTACDSGTFTPNADTLKKSLDYTKLSILLKL